ncbi:MAG: PA4642 family protein [Pseudomonadales bacterium]|nr:PA4642 family protein [Pseudomonadales bacterium]
MLKKDKEKVIGEEIAEETLKAFLDLQPYGDENPDFHVLTKAYRGLPPHEFARFLTFYKASGRDLNPGDTQGNDFISSISMNERQQEYVEILKQAGA